MPISREEVEHVARLARLDLTEDEFERFRGQLSAVLERAQRIQSLDLDELEPTAHPVELRNVLRPDEVVAPQAAAEALKAAPAQEDGYFRVPRILEDEDEDGGFGGVAADRDADGSSAQRRTPRAD